MKEVPLKEMFARLSPFYWLLPALIVSSPVAKAADETLAVTLVAENTQCRQDDTVEFLLVVENRTEKPLTVLVRGWGWDEASREALERLRKQSPDPGLKAHPYPIGILEVSEVNPPKPPPGQPVIRHGRVDVDSTMCGTGILSAEMPAGIRCERKFAVKVSHFASRPGRYRLFWKVLCPKKRGKADVDAPVSNTIEMEVLP